ncbi:MAG: glycosyltransferase [Thermoplasmata archaeon]|nr:MAG: glycosyltransferase [Thermoplasmata archaeon]
MEDLVSFIVPAYNNEKTIGKSLESILAQSCKKEVIVVDNCSTDNTRSVIEKFPVKILLEKKKGAGAARNRGLTVARGNYIAFVDADAYLPKDWALRAIQALKETDENVVCARGPLRSMKKSNVGRALDALSYGTPSIVKRAYVKVLNASGIMFIRRILDEIKFDEDFVRGQDTELGFRIIGKGYKILYDDSLYIYHHNPSTLKGIFKKWFTYGKSYPLSYLKHRRMIGIMFYIKVFYIPLFCVLIGLSFIIPIVAYIAFLQLFTLFFSYVNIGMKIPQNTLKISVLTFSVIHTFKQLAHMVGIWFGFFERMFSHPI